MMHRFRDRRDAGRRLAAHLTGYAGDPQTIVLALPRGGVPVAAEVASALDAPLDALTVRKLGAPRQPELAIGAIASGGVRVLDRLLIADLGISPAAVESVIEREQRELERRERRYRGDRPFPDLAGRVVILVDDGLATGSTMRAAIEAVRRQHPQRIVVAAPVGAPAVVRALREIADEVHVDRQPADFRAVSEHYDSFAQTTDDEIVPLLVRADSADSGGAPG